MINSLLRKHHLTWKILPLTACVVVLKVVLISMNWQPLALTALVTAAVSADVFLLGFLIAGSLPDYKEAERLPSEVAASLDTITDECLILQTTKPSQDASLRCLEHILLLTQTIEAWFHKRVSTGEVLESVRGLNVHFAAFEAHTQPNFIVRLKQEQQTIRRVLLRVRTIREVSFVATGYAIGELFTVFVVAVLVLTDMGNMMQSVVFAGGLAYLLMYMIALVKDLDNPFHYHKGDNQGDEVDVTPLKAVARKIDEQVCKIKS